MQRGELFRLNPLPIGAVFPTLPGPRTRPAPFPSQSPSYRGSLSYIASVAVSHQTEFVSIPFLSGQSFLPTLGYLSSLCPLRLNPLPIGAVFPTEQANTIRPRQIGLNPLPIGAVFPTNNVTVPLEVYEKSQSPSYRGSLSYAGTIRLLRSFMRCVSIPFLSGQSFLR